MSLKKRKLSVEPENGGNGDDIEVNRVVEKKKPKRLWHACLKCKTMQRYLPSHLKEVCLREAEGDAKKMKEELIEKGKDQEELLLSNIVYN